MTGRALAESSDCRTDVVTIGGEGVPLRVEADGAISLCGPSPEVPAGDRLIRVAPSSETGVRVERLIFRSTPGGGADEDGGLINPPHPFDDAVAPTVSVRGRADQRHVGITRALPDRPFWLVLGEGFDDRWQLGGAPAHGPFVAQGFANAWLVDPTSTTFEVTLRFGPRPWFRASLVLSAASALVGVALLATRSRRLYARLDADQEPLRQHRAFSYDGVLPPPRDARLIVVAATLATAILAPLWVAVVVGAAVAVTARREGWRWVLSIGPALLVAAVGLGSVIVQFRSSPPPGPGWPGDLSWAHELTVAAVALLLADAAVDQLWRRGRTDW